MWAHQLQASTHQFVYTEAHVHSRVVPLSRRPRRATVHAGAAEPQRARYLAAFAYVLGRVANADLDISDAETARMVDLVQRVGKLPEEQAILAVAIAKSQNKLFGGTENF